MPVQQSVDIAAPVETVYNQFTQFEEWPSFMHRVKRATQEDECTVSFAVKIWGITREFQADIETQRPDQRIKWTVSQGMTHTGIVTFHELGPNLTRVMVGFDVEPGGLLEKFARGSRHVKRAARGDLHRFKALIEMAEIETGAWRGVIEEGELVEEHDPSYDEQRQYADGETLVDASDEEDEDVEGEEAQDDEDADEEEPAPKRTRGQSRTSSSGRTPRTRGAARSGSSSSGGRARSSRRSGNAQSSGRQARSRSSS
jgi:carbon monoxide dehydrogenase subunit G